MESTWPRSSPAWAPAASASIETGRQTGKSSLKNDVWSPAAPGTYLYGADGGTSRLSGQTAHQAGVVPASISQSRSGAPMRTVPDIAGIGDPTTSKIVGQTRTFPDGSTCYSEYRIGSTTWPAR